MPTEFRVPIRSLTKKIDQNEFPLITASERKRSHEHHHRQEDNVLQKTKIKRSNDDMNHPSNFSDVSDDFGGVGDKDDNNNIRKEAIQHSSNVDAKMKNCFDIIDKAEAEARIDSKKAGRLRDCLHSDDAITLLLCEQIPRKRRGKGFYKCRICEVPLKGHVCPYCPVCSTPQSKIEKDDDHVCINCIKCYEAGKKKKQLVQLRKTECKCRN